MILRYPNNFANGMGQVMPGMGLGVPSSDPILRQGTSQDEVEGVSLQLRLRKEGDNQWSITKNQ